MGIIESVVPPRSRLLLSKWRYNYALSVRKFSTPPGPTSSHRASSSETDARRRAFSRELGRSRVCMTDSGAIESDLERFQKTFSRSPTYKAALSPRERGAVRHETSRTTIETRRTYTRTHACTRTYNSDDEEDERRRGTTRREAEGERRGG